MSYTIEGFAGNCSGCAIVICGISTDTVDGFLQAYINAYGKSQYYRPTLVAFSDRCNPAPKRDHKTIGGPAIAEGLKKYGKVVASDRTIGNHGTPVQAWFWNPDPVWLKNPSLTPPGETPPVVEKKPEAAWTASPQPNPPPYHAQQAQGLKGYAVATLTGNGGPQVVDMFQPAPNPNVVGVAEPLKKRRVLPKRKSVAKIPKILGRPRLDVNYVKKRVRKLRSI